MAASMENTLFQTAVSKVLESWTVLQLAVSHGFGGADSQEKAHWMVYAIDQWFKENRDIEQYEMENFLEDVMNTEFDTLIDDGSLPRVAAMICSLYRLSCEGKEAEIQQKILGLPRPQLQRCTKAQSNDDDDDDDECDEEDNTMDTGGANSVPPSSVPPMQREMEEANSQSDPVDMEEDDGWQVVRRGKKR